MSAVINAQLGEALSTGIDQITSSFTIIPAGKIDTIDIAATFEERHETGLEVADHPVQGGAAISDHSVRRPAQLSMRCGWSNSNSAGPTGPAANLPDGDSLSVSDYVSSVYSRLLALQASRQPFTVVTTIRQYTNMLITSLSLSRDQKTSQALMVQATLRQVIIVQTASSMLPPQSSQANPQSTAETENVGQVFTVQATPNPGGSASPDTWTATQSANA